MKINWDKKGVPSKVNIFGTDYQIVKQSLDSESHAVVYFGSKKILLDVDSHRGDKTKMWKTLFHELFHGALHETGVHQTLSPELEEIIVDNLARFTVNFLSSKKKS